ncbi:MAG: DUF4384 domain-containing protein [Alphaproteobacteria bacterium]|nr:DUF4384 domain-containing protein [Alphaproteobacteria bacterium]
MNQTKLPYVLGGAMVVGFAALSILSYNALRSDMSRTSEIVFFSAIKDSTDKAVLASYLDRYPDGMFAKAVQARLDEVAKGGPMIAAAGNNPVALAAMQAAQEAAQKAADEAKAKAQAEADKLIADARAQAEKAQQMAKAEAEKAEQSKAEAAKAQQVAKAEAEKAAATAKAEAEKLAASAKAEAEKVAAAAKAEAEKTAAAAKAELAKAEAAKAEAAKAQELAKAEAAKAAAAQAQAQAQPKAQTQTKVASATPAPAPRPATTKVALPKDAAAFVVISSTADGLKKGDRVGSGQQIAVPPGTRVVLMDGQGKVINVRGPFNGAPGGTEASGLIGRLSDALSTQQEAPRRVGAFRGVAPGLGLSGSSSAANPWTIDVAAAGDWCVATDQAISLTGGEMGGTFTVEMLPSGPKTEVSWPKGQATLQWPSGVPTKNDATYQFRIGDKTTAVKLHLMDRKGATQGQTALWMAERGCQRQAAAMIDSLERGIGGRLFDLEVGSDGKATSEYQVGDELKLSIRSTREAYVYCFYRDVAGEVTKIFPSQFDRSARIGSDGAQSIPSPSWQQPMQLTGPGGSSEVQCFALDRDATAHLPPEIAKPGFTVVPKTVAASLMDVFKKVPDGNMATAALPITVKE